MRDGKYRDRSTITVDRGFANIVADAGSGYLN